MVSRFLFASILKIISVEGAVVFMEQHRSSYTLISLAVASYPRSRYQYTHRTQFSRGMLYVKYIIQLLSSCYRTLQRLSTHFLYQNLAMHPALQTRGCHSPSGGSSPL